MSQLERFEHERVERNSGAICYRAPLRRRLFGFLLGVGLLLKSDRIELLNHYFSRWFSSDKMTDTLDRPRWIERFLYRHHRLLGASLFIGALYVLYIFLFTYNLRRISAAVPTAYLVVVDTLMAVLLVGTILAALVGVIVAARPSLLREIEKWANRWIGTEGIVRFFNTMTYAHDRQILRNRRISGVFIIAGSLYVLIVLVPLLWRGGLSF